MLFAAEIFWKIIWVASCTDSEGPLTVTCRVAVKLQIFHYNATPQEYSDFWLSQFICLHTVKVPASISDLPTPPLPELLAGIIS